MTVSATELQNWWGWFARVEHQVCQKELIVRRARSDLAACVSDHDRTVALDHLAALVNSLEHDAISAERLGRLVGAAPVSRALSNITGRLDVLSAELCDLIIAA